MDAVMTPEYAYRLAPLEGSDLVRLPRLSRPSFYLLLLILAFGVLLLPSVPYVASYPFFVGLFAVVTLLRPDVGLVALVLLQPSAMILRYKDPNSILVAGFTLEILAVFLLFLALRYFYLGAHKTVSGDEQRARRLRCSNVAGVLLLYILWTLAVSVFYWESPTHALLVFREHIAVLFLFPVSLLLLREYQDLDQRLVAAVFWGGLFPAVMSLLDYFAVVKLFPTMTRTLGDYVETRAIFGYSFARLNPFGGAGNAGGGVYYSVLFLMGLLRAQRSAAGPRLLNGPVAILFLVCAGLTLSFSVLLAFAVVVVVWVSVSRMRGQKKMAAFLAAAVVLVGILTGGIIRVHTLRGLTPLAMWTYVSTVGHRNLESVYQHVEVGNFFLGSGFDICSAGFEGVRRSMSLTWDVGWIQIFVSTGAIGFGLVLVFLKRVAQQFLRTRRYLRTPEQRYVYLAAGAFFFGMFGFVHRAALETRPLDVSFGVTAAIIVSLYARCRRQAACL